MGEGRARRLDLGGLRPPEPTVTRYRGAGHWRVETVLDDLRGWARTRPAATALVGRDALGTVRRISYAELWATVERYARALRELGVGPGEVVSTWLPTRWELGALMLATWRAGAALSPMMPVFGPREVERMVARVGSRVCVTVDSAGGVEYAQALARMAPSLPDLRHQIVLGTPGPGQLGVTALDGDGRSAGQLPETATIHADTPAIVMFTSGTTGEAKAAVHTLNTLGTFWASSWADYGLGADTVSYTPQSLSHAVGTSLYLISLRLGGTVVVMEHWDPADALELMEATGADVLMVVPVFLEQLLATGAPVPARLRHVIVGGTLPTRAVLERARRDWGLRPRPQFGMTEGPSLYQRPDDPDDESSDSIGHPADGLEVQLRGDGSEPATAQRPGRLCVRGPSVCLAVAGRDGGPAWVLAERDDGWYDTGDLAAPDGRGGYRLHGRAVDRVGGAFMIPVATVEDALREHPAITDVAVIETYDRGQPIPCAVVVPAADTPAPALDQVRGFLVEAGMTEFYLPRRLEVLPSLPRNVMGKVQKALLRARYANELVPSSGLSPVTAAGGCCSD